MVAVLRAVRTLNLPDWWVGAGFVRSKVWDYLHGYARPTPLSDIDVIYFDPADTSEAAEKGHELQLSGLLGGLPWSVKNQARMHEKNGDAPYRSSVDALSRWPETATCVAVTLTQDGRLKLAAPHGIADLVSLTVRPSPAFRLEAYRDRVGRKGWQQKWPNLTFHDLT